MGFRVHPRFIEANRFAGGLKWRTWEINQAKDVGIRSDEEL